MNDGALASALLFAALGLMLSFASRRVILSGVIASLAAALFAGLLANGPGIARSAVTICWISVLATLACLYLPRRPGHATALILCANGGAWAALALASRGRPLDIVPGIFGILLCLPGAWLVSGGRGIAIKVVGSWLAAAAILSVGLNMTPTLGYEPDHME